MAKSVEVPPEKPRADSSAKSSPKPPIKPEERELARKRAEQAAIEAELADRELRAASLRAELDEWKAKLAERIAREQPHNERAQQSARMARAIAGETKSAVGDESAKEPRAFKPSPEMKRLYRDVAKRIHPDLTSDRKDRAKRQQLMAEANQAYEKGDEARLAKILAEYDCSPEVVEGEGTGAELVRAIRRVSQARGRLAEIEAEMHELVRSDLYQLKSRVEEAEKNGRDVFVEMTEKVEEQIALAKERLEAPPSRARR